MKCSNLSRINFVPSKSREYVVEMNILMDILIEVDVVNGLQQATRNRHDPEFAVEPGYFREKPSKRTVAPFSHYVDCFSKVERIKDIRNVRMAQQHQLSKFLLGSRFNVFVRRGSFQNFYCKIVVPNIDATVHKTKKALTNLFAHRVRI